MPPQDATEASLRRLQLVVGQLEGPLSKLLAAVQSVGRGAETTGESVGRFDDSLARLSSRAQIASTSIQGLEQAANDYAAVTRETWKTTEEAAAGMRRSMMDLRVAQRAARLDILAKWMDRLSGAAGGMPALGQFTQFLGHLTTFKNTINLLSAALKVPALPLGVLLAVLGALAVVIGQLVARFTEAQQSARTFGGTLAATELGLVRLTNIYRRNRVEMLLAGVAPEQLDKTYQALNRTYGFSVGAAQRLGMSLGEYVDQATPAIIKTVGIGRVMGMTDEQTAALTGTIGVLGGDLRNVDRIFGRVAATANKVGLNADTLGNAVQTLGPANVFARNALDSTIGSLGDFAASISSLQNPFLNAANRAAMTAKAVQAIADASTRLSMPTILAFGGAMQGMTGSMDDILVRASKIDRAQILKRGLEAVGAAASPGSRVMAKTLFLMQQGVGDLNTAMTIAGGEIGRQRRQTLATSREEIARTRDMIRLNQITATKLTDLVALVEKGGAAALTGARVRGTVGAETPTPADMVRRRGRPGETRRP